MKKINRYFLIGLFTSVIAASSGAHAQDGKEFTIINHYDQMLQYKVGINPQVFSDLPETFSLASGFSKTAHILDMHKEAYIRVEDSTNVKNSAFWGIELINNQIKFHGYISKGIAYSWKDQIITFCTPQDYKKNGGHC